MIAKTAMSEMSLNSNYIPDFHQESCTLNFTSITHSNAFENKVR